MFEIERKYVIHPIHEYNLKGYQSRYIRQGYLQTGDGEVRIRQSGGTFDRDTTHKLTVKFGTGLMRQESEVVITERAIADGLMHLAEGKVIDKTRYQLGRWEIDQFHGELEGLWIAEVELKHVDEPTPPIPAVVRVKFEVTTDERYKNQSLATVGLPGFVDA